MHKYLEIYKYIYVCICVSMYFPVNIEASMTGNNKTVNNKVIKPISIFTQRKCALCSSKLRNLFASKFYQH